MARFGIGRGWGGIVGLTLGGVACNLVIEAGLPRECATVQDCAAKAPACHTVVHQTSALRR